jgi:hypothetical protein
MKEMFLNKGGLALGARAEHIVKSVLLIWIVAEVWTAAYRNKVETNCITTDCRVHPTEPASSLKFRKSIIT